MGANEHENQWCQHTAVNGWPAIDSSMLTPLVLMLIGAHGYFVIVVILRMRALLAERRLAAIRLRPGA